MSSFLYSLHLFIYILCFFSLSQHDTLLKPLMNPVHLLFFCCLALDAFCCHGSRRGAAVDSVDGAWLRHAPGDRHGACGVAGNDPVSGGPGLAHGLELAVEDPAAEAIPPAILDVIHQRPQSWVEVQARRALVHPLPAHCLYGSHRPDEEGVRVPSQGPPAAGSVAKVLGIRLMAVSTDGDFRGGQF